MIANYHEIIGLITSGWRGVHVLVVGDVMLDKYVWGEVERISPEAPVPIVRTTVQRQQPGGAANVAMNVARLGASTTLLGFGGGDPDQEALEKALATAGIRSELTTVPGIPTTSKLRVLGGRQQMLRLDLETPVPEQPEIFDQLIANALAVLQESSVVILSDYNKGTLSERVCQSLIVEARQCGLPVLVDPKSRSFWKYRGATTICPNTGELSLTTGAPAKDLEALLAAGKALLPEIGVDFLTVTLGEKGIAVLREDSCFHAPAIAQEVFDVSGAGDTVIAVLALALASKLGIEYGAQLANVAAGIVVGKVGTVPIEQHELLAVLSDEVPVTPEEKVLDLQHLLVRVAGWKQSGRKIVFTNGCFDLLHFGHITFLQKARCEGDKLIVAINSDRSVQYLKGPTRPIVSEFERAQLLAALSVVDAVIIFDESTPLELIKDIRPEVIVKGGDYSPEKIVGTQEVVSWGGKVTVIPTVEGYSTTSLIAKVMANS